MSEQKVSNSKYLVLDMKIVQNTKTRKDEIEMIMLDLNARQDDDCILDFTTTTWNVSRREPQWHELEKASKVIESLKEEKA